MLKNKFFAMMLVLLIAMMVISACQTSTPAPEATQAPTEETMVEEEVVVEDEPSALEALEGDVLADGSSTVYPVTTAVAEEFAAVAPNVRVSVGLSGTGGGFKKFCIGETDISDASRAIKTGAESEAELCATNGIEYVELLVALDGLTVMVNPENDWLESISPEQLGQLLGASTTITKWSDLDPSYPDEEILFFIPDPDSGTRDYMTEIVEEANGDEDLRQDANTTFSSDDNVLLDGIANELYSFGFFGFAYYINNTDAVRAVPVVNENGDAVLPSNETVQDGSYNPLARPLFIYVNTESLETKPQVAEFVNFYLSDSGAPAIMSEVGYSMPPAGSYEANMALVNSVLDGTFVFGTEEVVEEEEAAPAVDLATLEGDVLADGSSTVYPVTTAVAEEFAAVAPNVRVSVGLSGTGGGFKKFCIGETDISDASRAIKTGAESEAELCATNGIEYIELLVALDGLTVMVNPENDWLESISPEQLGQLLGTSTTITKWSDLDPSYPDEEILFFIPDPDSGTRDYMTEIVEEANGDEDLRQDANTTFSSDDNVLLDGIANEVYSFGFFGFAYYINNTDAVRAVPVVNENGDAVLPSNETVQDGSYNPLARPLFIYVNVESLRTKPQVAAFVNFFLSESGAPAIMSEVGYSMPPAGSYETNMTLVNETLAQ
jgi:phosphate transport system substrate-binding protein